METAVSRKLEIVDDDDGADDGRVEVGMCRKRWLHVLRDLPERSRVIRGELPAPRCPGCGLRMEMKFNNGNGGWLGCPPDGDAQ